MIVTLFFAVAAASACTRKSESGDTAAPTSAAPTPEKADGAGAAVGTTLQPDGTAASPTASATPTVPDPLAAPTPDTGARALPDEAVLQHRLPTQPPRRDGEVLAVGQRLRLGGGIFAASGALSAIARRPSGDLVGVGPGALLTWRSEGAEQGSLLDTKPLTYASRSAFSGDGDKIVLAQLDAITRRDAAGVVEKTVNLPKEHPLRLVVDQVGRRALMLTSHDVLYAIDLEGERVLWQRAPRSNQRVVSVALSDDGATAAILDSDHVEIVAMDGGNTLSAVTTAARVAHFLGNQLLAVGTASGDTVLMGLPAGNVVASVGAAKSAVAALASSPDHAFLALAEANGLVTLWDVGRKAPVHTWHAGHVDQLVVAPRGAWVAVRQGRRVRVLELDAAQAGPISAPGGEVVAAAMLPDGSVVTLDDRDELLVWDEKLGLVRSSLNGTGDCTQLARSGTLVAYIDSDQRLALRTPPTLERVARLAPPTASSSFICPLATSLQGDMVAVAVDNDAARPSVQLYRSPDWSIHATLLLDVDAVVEDLRFSPAGDRLVVTLEEKIVIVRAPDLIPIADVAITESVDALTAFSSAGDVVVLRTATHQFEVWDPARGVRTGRLHTSEDVESVHIPSREGPLALELDDATATFALDAATGDASQRWTLADLIVQGCWTDATGRGLLVVLDSGGHLGLVDPVSGAWVGVLGSEDVREVVGATGALVITAEGDVVRVWDLSLAVPVLPFGGEGLLPTLTAPPEAALDPARVGSDVPALVTALAVDDLTATASVETRDGRLSLVVEGDVVVALSALGDPSACVDRAGDYEAWLLFGGTRALALGMSDDVVDAWFIDEEQGCLVRSDGWAAPGGSLLGSAMVEVTIDEEERQVPGLLPVRYSVPLVRGEAPMLLELGELGVQLSDAGGEPLLELGDGVTAGHAELQELALDGEETSVTYRATVTLEDTEEGVLVVLLAEEAHDARFTDTKSTQETTTLLTRWSRDADFEQREVATRTSEETRDGGEFSDGTSSSEEHEVQLTGPGGTVVVRASLADETASHDECALAGDGEADEEPDPCCAGSSERHTASKSWSFVAAEGLETELVALPDEESESHEPEECDGY